MLESMVTEQTTEEVQLRLFELFSRTGNLEGLQNLVMLPTLAKSVDDKLARESNAIVRAKWMTRPGRTEEEVLNNLRQEKRVKVLVELVKTKLSPPVYLAIAKANKSHTLALSIMASDDATNESKEIAAKNLGRYIKASTRYAQTAAIREALHNNPLFYEAFAKEISDAGGLQIALQGTAFSPEIRDKLLSMFQDCLDSMASKFKTVSVSNSSKSYYWDPQEQEALRVGRDVSDMAAFLSAAWVPESFRQKIYKQLKDLETEVKSNTRLVEVLQISCDHLTSSEFTATLTDLVEKIRNAQSGEAVQDALVDLKNLRKGEYPLIALTALKNENLSVVDLKAIFLKLNSIIGLYNSSSALRSVGIRLDDLPVNSLVYLSHTAPWMVDVRTLEGERARGWVLKTCDALAEGISFQSKVANALLESKEMTTDLVKGLPGNFVAKTYPELTEEARERLGMVFLDLLATSSVTGWEQFERLAIDFNGSLKDLATLVHAATGDD